MAIVEIHIRNNQVEKVEGTDAYVYVHDHDIDKTTTMIFKKQEEYYETWTSTDTSRISSDKDYSDKISGNGNESSNTP